jgi:hypothetical protein
MLCLAFGCYSKRTSGDMERERENDSGAVVESRCFNQRDIISAHSRLFQIFLASVGFSSLYRTFLRSSPGVWVRTPVWAIWRWLKPVHCDAPYCMTLPWMCLCFEIATKSCTAVSSSDARQHPSPSSSLLFYWFFVLPLSPGWRKSQFLARRL